MEVHFHAATPPAFGRWACGAMFGQATGDLAHVDCPACLKTDQYQAALAAAKVREDEHAALSQPRSPNAADHEAVSLLSSDLRGEGQGAVPVHAAGLSAVPHDGE